MGEMAQNKATCGRSGYAGLNVAELPRGLIINRMPNKYLHYCMRWVKSALENHFSDRRNVLVERARFNRRVQRPGEPVDTFIQELYKIAADCEYGTLKNELIRDRIIVGVVDDSLSDRLQSKPKLTLQEAVQIAVKQRNENITEM